MRRCPRCTYPLHVKDDGKSELDNCHRCGGSWLLPSRALARFGAGADPQHWEKMKFAEPHGVSSLRCPEGHGQLDRWVVRDQGAKIEVDTCPKCVGLWLDRREGAFLARKLLREESVSRPYSGGVGGYLFQLLTGFPVEEWNPVRRKPVLIYSLLGTILAFALFQLLGQPAATGAQGSWVDRLALVPAALVAGDSPWTLVTHMFLHAGLLHLFGNLWFLWVFGDNVEDVLGRAKTGLLFLLSGVVGALAQVLSDPTETLPMVGASGAIAGLMGAYLILFPSVRVWIVFLFIPIKLHVGVYLVVWVLLQVLGTLSEQTTVAWWAHLGGFAAGLILALILRTTTRDRTLFRSLATERQGARRQPYDHAPHVNRRRYTSRTGRHS